jgi:excisionase family DNA binding protein
MAPLLTIRQVAELLRLSESTVRTMVERRIIPVYRVGTGRGSIRISRDDLRVYLENQREERSEPVRSDRLELRPKGLTRRPDGKPLRHFLPD